MADENKRKESTESADNTLNSALNKSSRELQLLANFYHRHGYFKQTQDIYKTIVSIREQRNGQDDELSGQGRAKSE
jgi:hypothetical protein